MTRSNLETLVTTPSTTRSNGGWTTVQSLNAPLDFVSSAIADRAVWDYVFDWFKLDELTSDGDPRSEQHVHVSGSISTRIAKLTTDGVISTTRSPDAIQFGVRGAIVNVAPILLQGTAVALQPERCEVRVSANISYLPQVFRPLLTRVERKLIDATLAGLESFYQKRKSEGSAAA